MSNDRVDMASGRPCHDWHWLECDRRECQLDGVRHVAQPGWEQPAWLCERHARESETRQPTRRDRPTTTIDRIDLAAEVAYIRAELAELQERFHRVMQDVRRLPGGGWLWHRIDAHPGVRLDRDMGAGQDADGWLAEVARFLEDDGDMTTDQPLPPPPRGPRANVRGPSSSGGITAPLAGHRPPPWPCGANGADPPAREKRKNRPRAHAARVVTGVGRPDDVGTPPAQGHTHDVATDASDLTEAWRLTQAAMPTGWQLDSRRGAPVTRLESGRRAGGTGPARPLI